MTNPFNRGSAPGRARDALQRSGSFEPGHKKRGGRKKRSRNVISPEHKRALLEAAHRAVYFASVCATKKRPRGCGPTGALLRPRFQRTQHLRQWSALRRRRSFRSAFTCAAWPSTL
jgi:hypothetical protein